MNSWASFIVLIWCPPESQLIMKNCPLPFHIKIPMLGDAIAKLIENRLLWILFTRLKDVPDFGSQILHLITFSIFFQEWNYPFRDCLFGCSVLGDIYFISIFTISSCFRNVNDFHDLIHFQKFWLHPPPLINFESWNFFGEAPK